MGATCLHSADWWRRHWRRSGIVDVELADTLENGWRLWRDWLQLNAPENETEMDMIETDAGKYLGSIRAIGRVRAGANLFDPHLSLPADYCKKPLLRASK